MEKLLLVLLATAAILGTTVYVVHHHNITTGTEDVIPTPAYDAWVHWKNAHGKKYSANEEKRKLAIWYENYKKIMTHNMRDDKTYEMGFNQFTDLSSEEFKALYLTLKPNETYNPKTLDDSNTPDSVDWRNKGAVTPVKNQGQCGSCWAFSTTGSLEGEHFLKTGKLLEFSEQQLVDCDRSIIPIFGDRGCEGGLMDRAFKYVEKNGITTEDKYPYKAVDQSCKTKDGVWKISTHHDVPSGSDSQLKAAVTQQPISIGVDAEAWQNYKSGVFSDCGSQMDHGVLLVGYTSEYWIVKNSWDTTWGENGYIRLAMGNTCGLENTASYPVA